MGGKETMKRLQELDSKVIGIVSSGYSNDPILAHYQEYGSAVSQQALQHGRARQGAA